MTEVKEREKKSKPVRFEEALLEIDGVNVAGLDTSVDMHPGRVIKLNASFQVVAMKPNKLLVKCVKTKIVKN